MKCYKCKKALTRSNTTPSVLKKRKGWCKVCEGKYRIQHRDDLRLYSKNYYITHASYRSNLQKTISFRHGRLKFFLKKACTPKSDPLWSLNFYSNLIGLNSCHYCLGPLGLKGYSLDKVDPRTPYAAHNVVPSCIRCNRVKLDHLSYDEMMEFIGPALRKLKESKEKP
jgi:hypothetical protein